LIVSRLGVIFVSLIAFAIAFGKITTIYSLVLYAWSGLGASFGPLLLLCLYSEKVNKYGAWAGILAGGIIAAIWPYVNTFIYVEIPSLLPAFIISFILIWVVSILTQQNKDFIKSKKKSEIFKNPLK
jgi:sodium/proline symporter